jgi:hypothetical protein
MMRSHWVKLAALTMLLVLTPRPAIAGVIYQTSFEPPTFEPGPLVGQDGWFPGLSPQAFTVSTELPRTGIQSVRADGSLLESFGGIFQGATGRNLNYNPIASGTPLVSLAGDINLTGPVPPGTSLGIGLAASLNGEAVANIQLGVREENGVFVAFLSNMDGVSASLPGYQLGEWAHVSSIFNFQNRTVEGFLNDQPIGTVPFSTGVSNDLPAVFIFMGCPIQPLPNSVGYIDNLSVTTVPEPSSLALAFLGTLGLLGYGWRWVRSRGS